MSDSSPRYDLVLSGGEVFDSATGQSQVTDVAVTGDRVARIGPGLAATARQVVDCTGQYVLPGLVEAHTHIFADVSKVGAPPDEAHLRRGVVAANDAGTVGAATFPAFEKHIAGPSRMRLVNFLNVSVLGLIDFRFGELLNPDTLVPEDALAVAAANPHRVRGFKIRLSDDVVGLAWRPLLKRSLALSAEAGLPLMVHIGETPEPLPAVLEMLRPGDVVAHCYTGKPYGILQDGTVLPEVYAARERGVLFESAHGRSNLSFKVAKPAIAQGFLPDVITSDTSARNWHGPVFDLVTSMAKLRALGMTIAQIVPRVTEAPARLLGLLDEGYGSLREGGPAHVTVLAEAEEAVLPDAAGNEITAPRLEPSLVLLAGEQVPTVPWRGAAGSAGQ
ncbi:amidohydrolase family protein [Micromonospora endophytica]|uniref:Amidohydrolase/deacetylase family metallohydrolase n=1 Tax=Micromonospora endophytica TaxID=515350 RepID=A0A2W2BTT8_9ACTN|nr:amidohydrolase family protein [Micromonospora endophytica]PZF89622.1 amidohydrolase/deacetylase family metallohydrolase [Micromonospora endophytica]RIW43862.1 amidohydrolase/deacetylase family metallohydrolase [Micromonospora endophytica]BCJ56966.1 amidohydrolase [Micromonospora endophytica]